MGYRLVEHTADIGVEVWAGDLAALCAECARALTAVLVEEGPIEPRVERAVTATGTDLPDLMVGWLTELILLLDTERLVFSEFAVSLEGLSLTAQVRGERFDPERHVAGCEVKAVTYHELDIREAVEGWEARIIFDI